jgi:hypothetical protein
MSNSNGNRDRSSGTEDGGQNDDHHDASDTESLDAITEALADAGADAGQTGHEISLRGDALHEQCTVITDQLPADADPDDIPTEELDALVTEALEAVGDIEQWSAAVQAVLTQAEALRATADDA